MESTDLPNPLHDLHAAAGAEFQAYDRLEIASTFGNPRAEYEAVRNGAALFDLPHRTVVHVSGADRLSFLNNLLTNQTWDKTRKSNIPDGTGTYAFFLNLKGRIVTDLNVLERGDHALLEMDARHAGPVMAAFDKYLFAEKVKLQSRLGSLHALAVHGPHAAEVLIAAGVAVGELAPLGSVAGTLFGFTATIWRDDPCGVPGYYIVVDTAAARIVWANLLANFGPRVKGSPVTLTPAGWVAFNTARIEAGRPLLGIDFEAVPAPTAYPAKKQREQEDGEGNFPGTLPAETGQFARAVSITKGCYLGQEIVARMHARNQVAKQIVGLQFEGDTLPLAGAGVFDAAGNQIGAVTSSTPSPALVGRAIALGIVKRPHFAPGTVLQIPAEGEMRPATVVSLPFIPSGPKTS